MNIDNRELANLIERSFIKWFEYHQKEYDVPDDFMPCDMDFRELAEDVLKDIKEIKGKWII